MNKHIWYPYTAMCEQGPVRPPLPISHGEGPYLFDDQGRRYIDGVGSWWVTTLGHQHPRLIAALKRQADRLCHVALAGITHEPAEELAEKLASIAPAGLTRVFFSDDGSTAVEAALRMALQFHRQSGQVQRTRFITLAGAFHGETVACASLSDMPEFHAAMAPVAFACERIPSPADGAQSTLASLRNILDKKGKSIAALIVEPLVQGAGGMRMHPPTFLQEARKLTREHGVLLILDEVFTGYGRTGTFWACAQAGICPDILCTAKGFTGGVLPMAATLATDDVFSAFIERGDGADRALRYGHSFCGNPLGCAVALEVLKVFEEEDVLAGIPARAALLQQGIEVLAAIPGVHHPRRTGMIAAVDLPPEQQGGYTDPVGWRVYDEALKMGAYLRPLGNVLYFVPPLNIPPDALEELMAIAEKAAHRTIIG